MELDYQGVGQTQQMKYNENNSMSQSTVTITSPDMTSWNDSFDP